MAHRLTLQKIEPVTHDTNHLVFQKPDGFSFEPGQATELTLMKDGWRDEARPFTFTSQPEDDTLEFVIKSYPDHDGVTEQIGQMEAGDEVEIGDAWGAIEDKGRGVFIAGGAGITPFIPILRRRAQKGDMHGCTLVFGAKEARDLILREEWDAMDGLETRYVLSEENHPDMEFGQIGLNILNTYVAGKAEHDHKFYVCGPEPMIDSVIENLKSLGVEDDRIIREASG